MSIWGSGNFQRDDAQNVLDRWNERIIAQIRETFQLQNDTLLYEDFGESRIIANIDILITLLEHYETYPYVERDEVLKWRENYLQTFDRTIHNYTPTPEFVAQRREIIVETFNRLYEVVDNLSI